jgi:DNA-binding transcriptional LysR family regulator
MAIDKASSPSYFEIHSKPKTPQDLTAHRCINQRVPSAGGLYVWDVVRRGKQVNLPVDGPLIFNTSPPQIDAALAELGIVLLHEDELASHLSDGTLVRVLDDSGPPFAGYHLYYPSRRQPSPAFSLVVNALRVDVAGPP